MAQQALRVVLRAYAMYDQTLGYCQVRVRVCVCVCEFD